MTPAVYDGTLEPLAAALAVDASPSQRELDDLRGLVEGTRTTVTLHRMDRRARRHRAGPAMAIAAAIAIVAAVSVGALGRLAGAPDATAPSAVAPPIDRPHSPAPASFTIEVTTLRAALVKADVTAVEAARDQLVQAFDLLPAVERERVRADVEALLAEAYEFLTVATNREGTDSPTAAPPAGAVASDDVGETAEPDSAVDAAPEAETPHPAGEAEDSDERELED